MVGVILIGCLALIFAWQYCKSDDSADSADSNATAALLAGGSSSSGKLSLAADLKAKLAPADLEQTLRDDAGARAALAKDLAAQDALVAAASRRVTAAPAVSPAVAEEDRKALDSGSMV
jgi:adenylylsulfate kinase-like enzyme